MKRAAISVLVLCATCAGGPPASYGADARDGCPPQVATTPAPAASQAERGPSTQKPHDGVVRSEAAETHGNAGVTTGASGAGQTAARECPEEHGGPRVPPTR